MRKEKKKKTFSLFIRKRIFLCMSQLIGNYIIGFYQKKKKKTIHTQKKNKLTSRWNISLKIYRNHKEKSSHFCMHKRDNNIFFAQ